MTYFASRETKKHYFSLFFSRKKVDDCNGWLFVLNESGLRYTSLLPGIAVIIGVSTLVELVSWTIFLSSPRSHDAHSFLSSINWGVLVISLVSATLAGLIVCFSQIYAVKHKDIFRGGLDCRLQIDWLRSLSALLINVLFAANGILVMLWAHFSPNERAYDLASDFDYTTMLIFFCLAAPAVFRLIWLFRVRRSSEIKWGGSV